MPTYARGNQVPIEIERKFLVISDDWKRSVVKSVRIRDGLVAYEDGRKVRVRITQDRATIAIKGPHSTISRSEYEYEIPTSDAAEIQRTMCDGRILEKVRHRVPHAGLTWEIDVYEGILEGVVFAEVEIDREDRAVELPVWIGAEVTGDHRYSKIALEQAYREKGAMKGIGANPRNDEKRAHLTDLHRKHLTDHEFRSRSSLIPLHFLHGSADAENLD